MTRRLQDPVRGRGKTKGKASKKSGPSRPPEVGCADPFVVVELDRLLHAQAARPPPAKKSKRKGSRALVKRTSARRARREVADVVEPAEHAENVELEAEPEATPRKQAHPKRRAAFEAISDPAAEREESDSAAIPKALDSEAKPEVSQASVPAPGPGAFEALLQSVKGHARPLPTSSPQLKAFSARPPESMTGVRMSADRGASALLQLGRPFDSGAPPPVPPMVPITTPSGIGWMVPAGATASMLATPAYFLPDSSQQLQHMAMSQGLAMPMGPPPFGADFARFGLMPWAPFHPQMVPSPWPLASAVFAPGAGTGDSAGTAGSGAAGWHQGQSASSPASRYSLTFSPAAAEWATRGQGTLPIRPRGPSQL